MILTVIVGRLVRFIVGAVSGLAGPAAGSALKAAQIAVTSTNIAAGTAVINGVAGVGAYFAGVAIKNAIDVPAGHAPEKITWQGAMFSALLNSGGSAVASKLSPVTSGQYSLRQASYFAPGRSWQTLFSTQNARNQYLQVIESNFAGTIIGTVSSPVLQPKKTEPNHHNKKVVRSPSQSLLLQAY